MSLRSPKLNKRSSAWSLLLGGIALSLSVLTGCFSVSSGTYTLPTDSGTGDSDTGGEAQTCEGVVCGTPSASTCADSQTIETFNQIGWCSSGTCTYASQEEICFPGNCVGGICESAPCQGVTCASAPAPVCVGDDLGFFLPFGKCTQNGTQPVCNYTQDQTPCAEGCSAGACINNPCAAVICNLPPARYCEGDSLVVFTQSGQCSEGDCLYLKETISCGTAGCADGRCTGEDLCAHVSCRVPPASHCVDGDTLRYFQTPGTCSNGACTYLSIETDCAGSCSNGQCSDAPCLGVSCLTPPAPHCKDANTLIYFDSPGTCTDGLCGYTERQQACTSGCEKGFCLENPCQGVVCQTPPANHCDGDVLVEYQASGVCQETGWCSYGSSQTPCPEGCAQAACLGAVDTETETTADTGAANFTLVYKEQIIEANNYYFHHIHIGPGTSLDPESLGWDLAADSSTLNNLAAADQWGDSPVIDLSFWAGQTVRIAFEYVSSQGTINDAWLIDDVCIGPSSGISAPTSCSLVDEDFESPAPPNHPIDWFGVEGSGHAGSNPDRWMTSTIDSVSGSQAEIMDLAVESAHYFLLTPPFTLE